MPPLGIKLNGDPPNHSDKLGTYKIDTGAGLVGGKACYVKLDDDNLMLWHGLGGK